MMASPSTVITMGYGNGTLAGTPSLVLTLGYGIGAAIISQPTVCFDLPSRPMRFDMPTRPVRFDLRKR